MKGSNKLFVFTVITISIVLMAIGCSHYNPDKDKTPHHNTTYLWGVHYWKEVWPADKVVASADSTSVDIVYLKSDGVSWEGSATTLVLMQLEPIIESVTPENRYKIRGAGIINGVAVDGGQTYKDSVALSDMGFMFGQVYSMHRNR